MTGSGMGCPDWPKCFGYTIPPTDIETLTWAPNRSFDEGNIIIVDERLLVANRDFISTETFQTSNWDPYTKHDYAIFNPTHTWIEFINRLIGAFTGLPVLALALLSITHIRRDPWVTLSAFLGLFLLLFEAWLGKKVVDGNLIPNQITLHMFGALGLVAIFTFLVTRLSSSELQFKSKRNPRIAWIGLIGLILLLIQIFLGTDVREQVDVLVKNNFEFDSNWIDELSLIFKFHRSFSILVVGILGYFAFQLIRTSLISAWPRILLALLLAEVLVGMGLAYLGLPAALQPIHLLFAVFKFSLVIFLLFSYRKKTVRA